MEMASIFNQTVWIERIMARPENKVCFDCGAKDPNMAAVLHAVVICDDCAQIHDTFDSSISYTCSIYFHRWTQRELLLFVCGGGNELAQYFFEIHGWTGGGDLEAKYTSEAATLYRKFLLDEAHIPSPPSQSTSELPDINVTEDLKQCTLEDENPETSLASSSDYRFVCAVNEPPPLCSAQSMIDQVTIQETDEARRRFPNAKSISSAQFFGYEEKMNDTEAKHHLQKIGSSRSYNLVGNMDSEHQSYLMCRFSGAVVIKIGFSVTRL